MLIIGILFSYFKYTVDIRKILLVLGFYRIIICPFSLNSRDLVKVTGLCER